MKKICHRIKILFLLAVLAAGFLKADVRAEAITDTTLMYALSKVNVRQGPDTGTAILGELEQGEHIFAVELTEEGWYRVVFNGETGYVRQDFLAVYGTEGEWVEPSPEEVDELMNSDQYYDPDKPVETLTPKITKVQPEGEAQEEAPSSAQTKKSKSKINISTIIIIVLAVAAILVYSAVQIVMEKRNGGEALEEEEYEEEEPEEEDEEEVEQAEAAQNVPEEDASDILDLDEEI